MPGYSIEWNHKASKPTVAKESFAPVSKIPLIACAKVPLTRMQTIPTKDINTKVIPAQSGDVALLNTSELKGPDIAYHPPKSAYALNDIDTTFKKAPKHPHFYTGDEEEDEYAHKSLVDGILALAIPAAGFLIMLGIVFSVGETIATAPAYAVIIFAISCIVGLVFAIFAFIHGFQGLNEINAQPDTYTGAGDAVLGMILAALEPLGILAYFLLRSL